MAAVKRRRLSDLYVRGKMLEISDGEGEAVKVWMAKLNELDRETALRRANAVKAKFLIDADNEESDTFLGVYGEAREINNRDDLVSFVIAEDISRARNRIEAELAADEETWGKDGYLQGLVDAWVGNDENPGLAAAMAEDPNDPEAARVDGELKRFEEQVRDGVNAEITRLRKDWVDTPMETLWRKSAHRLLEMRADEQFIKEFIRQQLFFSLRDPVNRRMRYFDAVSEIDDLEDELRDYLREQYQGLTVGSAEGKDSPSAPSASTSSDPPEEETSPPSGPGAAAA